MATFLFEGGKSRVGKRGGGENATELAKGVHLKSGQTGGGGKNQKSTCRNSHGVS